MRRTGKEGENMRRTGRRRWKYEKNWKKKKKI